MMNWMIDGEINLTEICEREGWHRLSVVDALEAQGIGRGDAQEFTEFAFNNMATIKDEDYMLPENLANRIKREV